MLSERLPQVRKQVRRVLQAHGNSHCTKLYPRRSQLRCTNPVMGRKHREHYKGFDSPQTCSQKKDPGPVAESPSGSKTSLHVKRQHAPKASHLPPGEAMV